MSAVSMPLPWLQTALCPVSTVMPAADTVLVWVESSGVLTIRSYMR